VRFRVEVKPEWTGRVFSITVEADTHAEAVVKAAATASE
jgi:hypothetical protein